MKSIKSIEFCIKKRPDIKCTVRSLYAWCVHAKFLEQPLTSVQTFGHIFSHSRTVADGKKRSIQSSYQPWRRWHADVCRRLRNATRFVYIDIISPTTSWPSFALENSISTIPGRWGWPLCEKMGSAGHFRKIGIRACVKLSGHFRENFLIKME
jgi:hypothetical protein